MKPILILRFSSDDGPGYFAEFLDARGLPWTLVCIDEGEAPPASLDAHTALVLMGGPMSVNDPLPWIPPVLALIREAVALSAPVLGHCLGGQLMSRALGGAVRVNAVKEIGWQPVAPEDNDTAREWLGNLAGSSLRVFQWHGDTFSLPPGATRILGGAACTEQGFVLGDSLALQCHIEMTPAMVHEWCADWDAEGVAPSASVESAEAIAAGIANHLAPMRQVSDRLYARWLDGVARHAARGKAKVPD